MDISIVIPCYNHGLFIQEAIDSVFNCKELEYEIIITDDGSTDEYTLRKLHELRSQGIKILSQKNMGPASARNAAIEIAKSKYILPLDADNKVKPEYLHRALKLLKSGEYDIVYGNPIFFGENIQTRKYASKPFIGTDLFFDNFIDSCAIYKKEVWEKLGGYDDKIPYHGQEDWEFWLHAYINNFKFLHLNEGLFYYRIAKDSLISRTVKADTNNCNKEYVLKKHLSSFIEIASSSYSLGQMYKRDMANPGRSAFKYFFRLLIGKF